MLILETTDTDGDSFAVQGGEYQIVCNYGSTQTKLQILAPDSDPEVWIDTDAKFTNNGVKAIWLSADAKYRMTNDTAGSKCWIMPLYRMNISNRV